MKKGWEYKKLGEVGTFKRGGNFSKKDFIEKGFPCIHYGQIHMKFGIETFKHLSSVPAEMVKPDRCAQKGDLVIAVTSEDDAGSCKCTAWMGDYEAYVGGHAAIYRHTMEPKYVSYYFMSPYFQKAKLEYTHGFKVVEINPKDIANISIPVPPLSEQKEIVEYLDYSFAKIDKLKENAAKNLEEAKALFQSALKDALEPKEGWEEKTLEDICDFIRGPFGGSLKKDCFKERGYAVYEQQNAIYNRFTFRYYIDEVKYQSMIRFKVNPGDLIMSCSGTIGKVAIIPQNAEAGIINQALLKLTPHKEIKAHYLKYLMESKYFEEIINANIEGVAIKNIASVATLKKIAIVIPSISEQQSIVSYLDSLNEMVNTLQQNYSRICDECDALKQAILRQVFE